MSEEWIVGKNPIIEALRSGRTMNKIWIAEGTNKNLMGPIFSLAKEQGVIVTTANRKKLDQLCGTDNHQGVIASVAAYDYVEVEDILKRAEERNELPFLILLDELEDPHNLGSIMRTADAVGAHGIVIPKRRSVSLTATVAKASMRRNQLRPRSAGDQPGSYDGGTEGKRRLDRRDGRQCQTRLPPRRLLDAAGDRDRQRRQGHEQIGKGQL